MISVRSEVQIFPGPPTLVPSIETNEIADSVEGLRSLTLSVGCLTLLIGCKARLDASSGAHDGFLAVVRVVGSGSDSARVNEVAKLCRAVVRMTKGKKSSEGSSAGLR